MAGLTIWGVAPPVADAIRSRKGGGACGGSGNPVTVEDIILLGGAGLVAGIVNAVAGGGTFFTFSAMVATGLPSIVANASSAVAVLPGAFASAAAYRREAAANWRHFAVLGLLSLIGSALGALILMRLEDAEFRVLVPWLLMGATVLFAFSPKISAFFRERGKAAARSGGSVGRVAGGIIQFFVAMYGGFFGAGMGILMLASLAVTEGDDFHRINAAKVILSILINGIAVTLFIVSGIVNWPAALVVMATCIAGGYLGVVAAKAVPVVYVRWFVVGVGTLLSLYFFGREYL